MSGVYLELSYCFPCGWELREVLLDREGRDLNGWRWHVPEGRRLYHCSDGIDSVTVTAANLTQAVAILDGNGMPPARLSKQNWHSGAQS